MTRQKHLKDAVRARMERTGESYTAARRHVVPAERGGPAGGEHDSSLLAAVLATAGVTGPDGAPLGEPVVAGLAGGIGFMYFSFSYAGHPPTMTIVPRIHPRPFVAGALERAGIAHRVVETTSAAKAARELDTALAAGRTPICTVDLASLPHRTWLATAAGAAPHEVTVLDRRDGAVVLDDALARPVTMAEDSFAAARAGHRQSKQRMVVVEAPAGPVELAPALRAALAVTVHDLTEDVMPNNFAGNFGLRGLAKWADAVADRRTRSGWSRLFGDGPAFGSAMQRLHDCLTTEYSSPGAMRPLYAAFLAQAAAVLDDAALTEAAGRYADAGRLWTRIAEEAVAGPMACYAELVERRRALLATPDRVDELRAVAEEAAAAVAGLDVGEGERAARLDAIAALAAEVLAAEREACAALRAAAT